MAYLDLSNDAMVAISQAWVNTGDVRKAIARYAPLAGLLTLIERAHEGVFALTTSTKDTANEQALAELTQRQTEADLRHDRAIRGAIAILDAATYVASDDKLRATLSADRAELYPSGASITQATYAEESGAALALEKRSFEQLEAAKAHHAREVVDRAGQGRRAVLHGERSGRRAARSGPRAERDRAEAPGAREGRSAGDGQAAHCLWGLAREDRVGACHDAAGGRFANELDELSEEDRRAIFGALAKALEGVERPARGR